MSCLDYRLVLISMEAAVVPIDGRLCGEPAAGGW
jgi:hypothetical protein